MPLYDFKCDNCNFIKEVLLPSARETIPCPKCGEPMRRLLSFPGLVKIKGEGGYPFRRKKIRGTAPYS